MSQGTLARLRSAYEAFYRGDPSVAVELATPDVEWGTTGKFPGIEGRYRWPQGDRALDGRRSLGLGEVRGDARGGDA